MNAMKYRRKPLEVEALLWDGSVRGATTIIDWMLSEGTTATYYGKGESPSYPAGRIAVITREGTMSALPGDYMVREPTPAADRRFYPCKPDIFKAGYDQIRSHRTAAC